MIIKRNPNGTIAANGILRKYFSIEEARAGKKVSLKLWKERNIDKIREYNKEYRKKYKLLNGGTKMDSKTRQSVYERNIIFYKKLTCVYCGVYLSFGRAEIDHIVPFLKNGTNEIKNLCISCKKCNQRKFTKPVENFTYRG